MSILLVGSEGAQGKRYQSILRYLGRRVICLDEKLGRVAFSKKDVDAVIITTPTETHAAVIRECLPYKMPILIEKPITKNVEELKELFLEAMSSKVEISMMMQYRQISTSISPDRSAYDYFRHGRDGLVWDCLQVIGLARGPIELKEESPIWNCEINGETLNLQRMDMAYVLEVRQWLTKANKLVSSQILEIHQKVKEFEATF